MTKGLLAACAMLIAANAYASRLTLAQEAEVDRITAQTHREVQRMHVRWYRGFLGDGINQCTETGGKWTPSEDLVRNNWMVRLDGATELSPGQYAEIYSDGGSTTLVYATTLADCQQVLNGLIESQAQRR